MVRQYLSRSVMTRSKLAGYDTRSEANAKIGRTVWSSPQVHDGEHVSCSGCKFFADSKARVSSLALRPESMAGKDAMTFGWCKNLRIWAATGREVAPIMRSYYFCNYYKEKENGS